jgi:hypothetical protein
MENKRPLVRYVAVMPVSLRLSVGRYRLPPWCDVRRSASSTAKSAGLAVQHQCIAARTSTKGDLRAQRRFAREHRRQCCPMRDCAMYALIGLCRSCWGWSRSAHRC